MDLAPASIRDRYPMLLRLKGSVLPCLFSHLLSSDTFWENYSLERSVLREGIATKSPVFTLVLFDTLATRLRKDEYHLVEACNHGDDFNLNASADKTR